MRKLLFVVAMVLSEENCAKTIILLEEGRKDQYVARRLIVSRYIYEESNRNSEKQKSCISPQSVFILDDRNIPLFSLV